MIFHLYLEDQQLFLLWLPCIIFKEKLNQGPAFSNSEVSKCHKTQLNIVSGI